MDPVARTVLLAFALAAGAAAYSPVLDQRAINEALALGQSYNEATRERFHLGYRVNVGRAPVDYIEVITPFRRLVLAAEERARIGDRFFAQRDAVALLAVLGAAIQIVVELTFHPFNTYLGVPEYDVALENGGRVLRALNPQRLSRFTPRVAGVLIPGAADAIPGTSQPLLGGTVIARFERTDLDVQAGYDVVIRERGSELARGRVELGTLR